LVATDHRFDDRTAKGIELVAIHLQGGLHLRNSFVTLFVGDHGQIPAELGKRKRIVHLFQGAVRLIEQRLRVFRDGICDGSHGESSCSGGRLKRHLRMAQP